MSPKAQSGASESQAEASTLSAADRRGSAATKAAWGFARVEEFSSGWKPLTPWGKDFREARLTFREAVAIEAELDRTEAWIAFAKRAVERGEGLLLDRLAWHLGRVPRLPQAVESGTGSLGLVEIFVARKFIFNYKEICRGLDAEATRAFGLLFESEELSRLLEAGGADAETFAISDSYDARLGSPRRRLVEIDASLAAGRRALEARILAGTGLDFAGRDFVLAPISALLPAAATETLPFEVEAWDGLSHLLRLRRESGELALEDERACLLDEEGRIEGEVILRLSQAILSEAVRLRNYALALRNLDLARARATLLEAGACSRPRFSTQIDGRLLIKGGRLLPLAADCEGRGLHYTPLDLDLVERAAVIFGSNMGGKTVVLETTLFLQILAQAGFHVPAASFETRVYPLIHYVGEGGSDTGLGAGASRGGRAAGFEARPQSSAGGLSGFGREIRSFVECGAWSGEGALLCFDEFARTTSSNEAEALLSAALDRLSSLPGRRSLFSTHFRGVERTERVRWLRMRGLDREAAAETGAGRGEEKILEDGDDAREGKGADLLGRINALMKYELVEDSGEAVDSDAILIAGLLGLDPTIVRGAAERYALSRDRRKERNNEG